MSTTRRQLDQYFTPAHATRALLMHVSIQSLVGECCNGDGAISSVLRESGLTVITNDIDTNLDADFHVDVTKAEAWNFAQVCWLVTNPPFNRAAEIVPLAYRRASCGIAMLLRLSYLEPCMNRDLWLRDHPPTKLIVLPRISFTGNGKTDNVTCAWMVWDKRTTAQEIIVVPRSGR